MSASNLVSGSKIKSRSLGSLVLILIGIILEVFGYIVVFYVTYTGRRLIWLGLALKAIGNVILSYD